MANSLYDAGRTLMLSSFDWVAQAVDAYLVDTTIYHVDTAAHSVMTSVTSGVVAGPIALASKAIVAGAADAGDVTFPSVVGAICQAIVLAKHTGSASTDTLLAYIDSSTGLPITPNGGDIIVVWDNGVNRIFKP